MPQREFFCHGCKQAFSKVLEQAEYEEGSIACPRCGSRKVAEQVSPFGAITSEKSPSQSGNSRERVNSSASEEDDRARVLSDWEGEGGASGVKKEAAWVGPEGGTMPYHLKYVDDEKEEELEEPEEDEEEQEEDERNQADGFYKLRASEKAKAKARSQLPCPARRRYAL